MDEFQEAPELLSSPIESPHSLQIAVDLLVHHRVGSQVVSEVDPLPPTNDSSLLPSRSTKQKD